MGRVKGQRHKKIHFKVDVFNPVSNEWCEKGKYPTIEAISRELGYSYHTTQNIRLNRHKTLCKFIRITKL